MSTPRLDRRRLLLAGAAGLAGALCGCSARPGTPAAAPTTAGPSPVPTPSPTAVPTPPALPPVTRWTPSARETLPALKAAAADVVAGLCTRLPGQTLDDALAAVAPLTDGLDAAALAPLGEGRASTGEVVYAQFGGLSPIGPSATTGACMVVVRQVVLGAGGRVATTTRTVDVRLRREGDRWRVTGVPSVGGEPVARPADLAPAAVRLLDDPAVLLPDSARWDVHAGRVSARLLALLGELAGAGGFAVTAFASGHPVNVFGTGRVSDHTAGLAADLWRVGAVPVVDDRSPGGPAARLQGQALLDRRASQVGSPPGTDLDGTRSRRSFANLVHEDHLHLAVRR